MTGCDGAIVPLPSVARLEHSLTTDDARCEHMRCVGVVVDRVDLGALGGALALGQGDTRSSVLLVLALRRLTEDAHVSLFVDEHARTH